MERDKLCDYLQKKLAEVKSELENTTNDSTHSRLTGKYIMLLEIADDLKLDILPPYVETTKEKAVLTEELIKSQLEELRGILKEVSTIQDCIDLKSKGFEEILVDVGNGFPIPLEDAKNIFPDWHHTKVTAVWVSGNYNVNVAYYIEKDDFIFDIYENVEDEYPVLVDVTLDDLAFALSEYKERWLKSLSTIAMDLSNL